MLYFLIKGMGMKNLMKVLILAVIFFCFLGISEVSADPSCMRCNNGYKMVCIGSPASTVLAKCGAPLSIIEVGSKTRGQNNGIIRRSKTGSGSSVYYTRQNMSSTTMKLEEWTYCIEGYGSDCYIYVLRFTNKCIII